MTRHFLLAKVAAVLAVAALSPPVHATLITRQVFANAALSVDGFGGTSGQLQAVVPVGATVLKAYLYSSDVSGSGLTGSITFAGTPFAGGSGTALLPNLHDANHEVFDVTSLVAPVINVGPGGTYNFTIAEGGSRDGEVLVVVYQSATTAGNTAIIMDGELSLGGDSTTLNFSSPYTSGDLIMSLASAFSYNGDTAVNLTGQVTNIDVTTSSNLTPRRLTSCAGGNDDGGFVAADGSLMTAGGVGDSSANPNPNCAGGAGDDELYNLALGNSVNSAPFLNVGDTSIKFTTNNPSFDDYVFGLFFTTSFAVASVDDGTVPEPGSLALLGLGLVGVAMARRKQASSQKNG